MNQHLETDLLWFDETPSVPAGPTPSLRGRTPEQAPQRGLSPRGVTAQSLGLRAASPLLPLEANLVTSCCPKIWGIAYNLRLITIQSLTLPCSTTALRKSHFHLTRKPTEQQGLQVHDWVKPDLALNQIHRSHQAIVNGKLKRFA